LDKLRDQISIDRYDIAAGHREGHNRPFRTAHPQSAERTIVADRYIPAEPAHRTAQSQRSVMFTKRRGMNILAASSLSAALTCAVGTPAQAAAGSALNVPFTPSSNPGYGFSVLPTTFPAGDCRLMGVDRTGDPAWARVELAPASATTYRVIWNYDMYTTSTWWGDVWHQTFIFKTAGGAEISRFSTDGENMNDANVSYSNIASGNMNLTVSQFNSIAYVDWRGDC
jgi:hypothetical protein